VTIRGLVLGKFLPPHAGHLYLVDVATRYADRVYVVVEHVRDEPIPSELRFRWMQELLPNAEVLHLTEENPQAPEEHPRFWEVWKQSLDEVLPEPVDLVFASESYGSRLAEVMGARFVPVDPARRIQRISGTEIRRDPLAAWEHLPAPVRAHFARRVCVFGPESTGKSTLAARLAEHFETTLVPEYARTLIEAQNGDLCFTDIEHVARGQRASEDSLARQANRLLVCDTDLLTTTIWSDVLFGSCPQWIRDEACARPYDLTLLCDVDVPWVDDVVRYLPDERRSFFERCEEALRRHDRRYVVVRGDWDTRFEVARKAVARLLGEPATMPWKG
jgi:NadR type nicotinamide-nucleotide adenylyltransferase